VSVVHERDVYVCVIQALTSCVCVCVIGCTVKAACSVQRSSSRKSTLTNLQL